MNKKQLIRSTPSISRIESYPHSRANLSIFFDFYTGLVFSTLKRVMRNSPVKTCIATVWMFILGGRVKAFLLTSKREALWVMLSSRIQLYCVNLEWGALSRYPNIVKRIVKVGVIQAAEPEIRLKDPRDHNYEWSLGISSYRSYLMTDMLLHVSSGTPLIEDFDGINTRTVGVTSGAGSYEVSISKPSQLFSRRVTSLDLFITVIPVAVCSNYFHWVIEHLPCLLRSSEAATQWGLESVKIARSPSLLPWQEVSLNHLGYEQIYITDQFIRVNKVLFSGTSGLYHFGRRDSARLRSFQRSLTADKCSDEMIKSCLPQPMARIAYISRRNSTRFTQQEVEAEALLLEMDVECIFCEELSLQEQAQFFRGISLCVGAHGAGFANMVWMPSGSAVIELAVGPYWHASISGVAQASGLNYTYLNTNSLGWLTELKNLVDNHRRDFIPAEIDSVDFYESEVITVGKVGQNTFHK